MPLNSTTLQAGILAILEAAQSGQHEGQPITGMPQLAELWGDALLEYFSEANAPEGIPARGEALEGARSAAVSLLSESTFATGLVQLTTALSAFTAAILATALPALVVVPPPGTAPIVGAPLGGDTPVGTEAAAAAIALQIDAWVRLGTWAAPPSSPLPWA